MAESSLGWAPNPWQAGNEMIPLMEDAFEQILRALDRFHHEPFVCATLVQGACCAAWLFAVAVRP